MLKSPITLTYFPNYTKKYTFYMESTIVPNQSSLNLSTILQKHYDQDVEETFIFLPLICNQNQDKGHRKNGYHKKVPSDQVLLDIKHFLANDDFRDFTITTKDREFKVHKFLLAARSPILSSLIHKNPDKDSLELLDISSKTVERIVQYLYNNELDRLGAQDAHEIQMIVEKLSVKEEVVREEEKMAEGEVEQAYFYKRPNFIFEISCRVKVLFRNTCELKFR